ncbi:hypothetical protein CGRA01v4_08525 [Colletotrichum graminicola]|nr:hypothetical protein CGRA01v4_08525 [Colletotrichum graminicola]
MLHSPSLSTYRTWHLTKTTCLCVTTAKMQGRSPWNAEHALFPRVGTQNIA